MRSSQRYGGASAGRGSSIAVAAFATVSGVAALFMYHTSPGQGDEYAGDLTAAASDEAVAPSAAAVPAGGGNAAGGGGNAAAGGAGNTGRQTKAASDQKGGKGTQGGVTQTFTGARANTEYGTVQVKVTVRDGKVVAASAPKSPNGAQRSLQINKRAIPLLNKQAVAAGSAKIDGVSGATVTTGGYRKSLQSALDMAHL